MRTEVVRVRSKVTRGLRPLKSTAREAGDRFIAPLQDADILSNRIQGWRSEHPSGDAPLGPGASVAYPWLLSATATRLVERATQRLS